MADADTAASCKVTNINKQLCPSIREAEGEHGEEYGEERIVEFAIEHRSLSAHDLRRELFDEIDKWSGARERGDDQTVLIVKANE